MKLTGAHPGLTCYIALTCWQRGWYAKIVVFGWMLKMKVLGTVYRRSLQTRRELKPQNNGISMLRNGARLQMIACNICDWDFVG